MSYNPVTRDTIFNYQEADLKHLKIKNCLCMFNNLIMEQTPQFIEEISIKTIRCSNTQEPLAQEIFKVSSAM